MDDEPTVPTANGAITVIKGVRPEVASVEERLAKLEAALPRERDDIKRVLKEAVPTYTPEFQ